MTITQEECLSNAHDFERWAKQASNETDRATFVAMASLWTRLALNTGFQPIDNVVDLAARRCCHPTKFGRHQRRS
jgi:hypothetical protein